MDLSHWGLIPVGRGAASCRPHRSWPLGGLVVASPRRPILRPGPLNVTQGVATEQTPSPWTGAPRPRASACARFSRSVQIASARPANLSAGVM